MYILNGSIDGLKSTIRKEIEFSGNVARSGTKSAKTRRVQEWLCLHGFMVVVDGEFGPATELAVRAFQRKQPLQETGAVDEATFAALIKPMAVVLRPQVNKGGSLGETIAAIAKVHLQQHPFEVGSEANSGPWVRMYMDGNEGPIWLWCAGFVTFVMKQAAELADIALPVKGSFSCDVLAMQANEKGIFRKGSATSHDEIPDGSFFLLRRTTSDWSHTGIVTDAKPQAFHSIEGNTNDGGSVNGVEVCARTRGYDKKDFVVIN
ncbi:MAG: peptidoglycan-binding domain-containing protein [Amaricoccus sp.]|uniref:peptidoglycan-binding domain-containing protein n=1 Tax=Amaricoccus sp. TaxID=1872485 RepID=UPI0033160A73